MYMDHTGADGTYIDSQTFQDMSNFLREKNNITVHRRKKAPNPILAEPSLSWVN